MGESKAVVVLREKCKPEVSMAELANKIGVSRQQVWAWLHKKSQPSMKHMIALRDELGIELEWWVKP